MGSSKTSEKKSKKRKAEAADAPTALEDAVGSSLEPDHRVPSELAELRAVLDELGRRLERLERQLERTLLLHERTNTLLELLAGSAFDMELDGPPPR